MPPKKQQAEQQAQEQPVFEQKPDAAGRLVLDRPFTPEEARALDEANAKTYAAGRAKRFARPT